MNNEQYIIKRLQQTMQDDKISYYNLALDIGISNSVLYNIIKRGVRIVPEVYNKLQTFINNYETKNEQIARLQHECNILDGIIDVNNAKIGQLQKENERLKEEINEYKKHSKCAWKCFEGTLCEEGEKYKQTLQEIKKYIAKVCKEECGYVQKKRCLDCDCRFGAILDLITKAEEE